MAYSTRTSSSPLNSQNLFGIEGYDSQHTPISSEHQPYRKQISSAGQNYTNLIDWKMGKFIGSHLIGLLVSRITVCITNGVTIVSIEREVAHPRIREPTRCFKQTSIKVRLDRIYGWQCIAVQGEVRNYLFIYSQATIVESS